MYTIYNPIADFNDLLDAVFEDGFKPSNTVKSTICTNNFPPSDISLDEKESYVIDIAMAGYNEDDINVSYKDGYITVEATAPKKDETRKYAKKGIKLVDKVTTSYSIDINKYDITNVKVTMSNGILTIVVPVKKDFITSRSFGINGKKPTSKNSEVK